MIVVDTIQDVLTMLCALIILEILGSITTFGRFRTSDNSMLAVADGRELAIFIVNVEGVDSRLILRRIFVVYVWLILVLAILLELDDLRFVHVT